MKLIPVFGQLMKEGGGGPPEGMNVVKTGADKDEL